MSAPAPLMFTPAAKAMVDKLGLKMGRANLEEFAAALDELARTNPNIVAVTSDSRGSSKLAPFGKALPKQIVEVGIAEQNLVGITAGLAACGKMAFGVSPSCFLTTFAVGKAITLREGSDVAFIATGETVVHALLVAGHLAGHGLNCRVLSMHSIKPLDAEAILKAGHECRAMVTVEEHMVNGGLGEACAAVLLQGGVSKPFRLVGIPDEETVSGAQADIFRRYGISMEG